MKQLLLSVFIINVLGLFSCERDWDCRCSVDFLDIPTTQDTNLGENKRKEAKAECESLEIELNAKEGVAASCKLRPA